MAELDTTVLYICQYYAPSTAAAGLRAERFVNALVRSGIRVIVVTQGQTPSVEERCPNLVVVRINSSGRLPGDIPEESRRRWPAWRMLPGPDPTPRYAIGTYQASQWAVDRYQPQAIIASGPPFSLMAVASEVSRQSGRPLILEFRDAWYSAMPWPYRSSLRKTLARYWERRCVRQASKIITVTTACRNILAQTYGDEIAGRIETIRHGFEDTHALGSLNESEQKNLNSIFEKIYSAPRSNPGEQTFTLAYTGQLRGIDVVNMGRGRRMIQRLDHLARHVALGATFCENLILEWMSPDRLIAALGVLAKKSPDFRRDLRLVFVGQQFDPIDKWSRQANLADNVFQLGRLSPGQTRRVLLRADLLILTLYGIKNNDYHWCVPSKVYDYLSTGKPILNLTPPGEANDMVNRAGVAYNAGPDDIAEIAGVIEKLYQQHRGGGISVQPDWDFIRRFQIAAQQEKFVALIRNAAHHKKSLLISSEGAKPCVA
jgi:hypothetical protein